MPSPCPPAPKRRWFRWSLRTLFVVVTVVGGWLAYELNWIKQRHEFLERPGVIKLITSDDQMNAPPPGLLWIFREKGVVILDMPMDEDMELAKTLFPEAQKLHKSHPPATRK